MRIRISDGLLPLNLLAVLLIAATIVFPSSILQIILGLPFVLFFPGYAMMAALFIRKEGMGGIERVAMSFGLSIAVVPLIGLILNYTSWGITLESILYSVASFIFVTSVIAWFRRKRLLEEERFRVEFDLALGGWTMSTQNKVLSIILVLTVLGAFGIIGYAISTPKLGQKFTEFYILGVNNEATDYPRKLNVGQEGRVTIGIINHEYETVSYRLEIRINGAKNNQVEPIVLENDEKWTQEVSFVPQTAGERQKVEFFLYKNGEAELYLEPLRLWIDVKE